MNTRTESAPVSTSTGGQGTESAPPLVALGLIAGAALAYEVLLIRLFSIIQWHHYAFMIISLALLGFGASGSVLTLAGQHLAARFRRVYCTSALLFAVTATGCYLIAQSLPFNALELPWNLRQTGWLALIYLLLMLPFFFAALCIGLALLSFPRRIARVYGADLLGSGIGSAAVVLGLFVLEAERILPLLSALGVASGLLALWRRRPAIGAAVLIIFLAAFVPPSWVRLQISEYKGLSQALRVAGARVVARRSSPLGQLTAVANPRIPFRYAPGLSLGATAGPPEQIAIFTDADAMTVVTRRGEKRVALHYLDQLTSALPYHLLLTPAAAEVLVLGAGGGGSVLQALYHGAARIDAVERNPALVALVRAVGPPHGAYTSERARVHLADVRAFTARTSRQFDLVQIELTDSLGAASTGLQGLGASHLVTVEAVRGYLQRLKPGGVLAVTRWTRLPPRDGPKLLATVVAALESMGIRDAAARSVWIRGWNTSTLLVRNGRWSEGDIERVHRFAGERSFDIVFHPGMRAADANRYNVLSRPLFHTAARALLGAQSDAFVARYKFDIRPATDDRPFFFDFFKWRHLPEFLRLRTRGGVALLDLGYPVAFATLVQAAVASLALIVLPVWWMAGRHRQFALRQRGRYQAVVYFLSIGIAFLFLEVAFIHRFSLFLAQPLYAVAGVLTGFLLFAGAGSLALERLLGRWSASAITSSCIAGIIVLGAAHTWLAPPLLEQAMHLPMLAKFAIVLAITAPLALLMGMPFPAGLLRLEHAAPELLPWAWCINGCASVVSAAGATLLAMHVGFSAVMLTALGLYAVAGFAGYDSASTRGPRAA